MRKIKENVLDQVNEKDLIRLAKDLVKIPSYTGKETECARFLAKYMKSKGFETELHEVQNDRFQVIGKLNGSGGGKSIMFNGHLDIDGIRIEQKRNPWHPTVENGRLYGHGIYNMKAGVTSMIIATEAIHRSGVKLKGDIIVAGVVGELQGGVGTINLLERGIKTDYAIVTEPTSLNIMTMHAGILELMITTKGVSKHIMEKEKGINALTKMIKIINALDNLHFSFNPMPELPGLPRLLIGSIIAGLGKEYKMYAYEIPDKCSILVDVRVLPNQTIENVLTEITTTLKKLKEEDPELDYEIKLPPLPFNADQVIMPPHNLPKQEPIVSIVKNNHKIVTGKDVNYIGALTKYPFAMSYSGDDDAHLYQAGIPAFCYGPGHPPRQNEPPDQYIEIDQMVTCAKVLALTALDVCK